MGWYNSAIDLYHMVAGSYYFYVDLGPSHHGNIGFIESTVIGEPW